MSEKTVEQSTHSEALARIIFKNAAFITLGGFALKGLTFLFNVYVIRSLGGERFGQYAIVLSFVGLFTVFLELGMTQYVMREIAKDRSKVYSLYWNLATLRFLLAILGIFFITFAGAAFGYSPEIVLGILLFSCTFLLAAFLEPMIATLKAYERFDYATLIGILGRVVFMVFGASALFLGGGFIWLVLASLIQIPFQIGLALWAMRHFCAASLPFRITLPAWPSLVKSGLPFGIISLMLIIAFSIDTVMLSKFEPDYVVGWYAVAYGFVFSINFLFRGFREAIVPSLSRIFVDDRAEVDRWYYRSVKAITGISIPIAVGGMIVAVPLILFLYTDEFLPSGFILKILIWDLPFIMFSSFCGNMTTIIHEERAAARIYTINTIANVGLNLYAIPRFGIVGASLVTVVTDLIGSLQFYVLLRHKLNLPSMTSSFIRILGASAIMGFVIWLAGDLHVLIRIGLGGLVYSIAVLVLRVLDSDELQTIQRLLRKLASLIMPKRLPETH